MDWDVEPDECLQSSTFWLYVVSIFMINLTNQHNFKYKEYVKILCSQFQPKI